MKEYKVYAEFDVDEGVEELEGSYDTIYLDEWHSYDESFGTDEDDAYDHYFDCIELPECTYAELSVSETYGGMVHGGGILKRYNKGDDVNSQYGRSTDLLDEEVGKPIEEKPGENKGLGLKFI